MAIDDHRGNLGVLLAASLVSMVLGSIHAFSVFIAPLEAQFSAPRATVSLTYSLALVSLTGAVLLGPRMFGKGSAGAIMMLACAAAAVGAVVAGMAGSLGMVWLGYSLIFGAANGLGYGFGLQIAAQAMPGREGLAMGIVTAAYALGSVIAPSVFTGVLAAGGFGAAMFVLAGVLLVMGAVSAGLMARAGARFHAPGPAEMTRPVPGRHQVLLWLGYFGGVTAGLMVIGHAAGIGEIATPALVGWHAVMIIAASNLFGSLLGGRAVDRLSPERVLAGLALATAGALAWLALAAAGGVVAALLGVIGFAYGGTIAAYPAAIAKLVGMDRSAVIYGRVFTAWGAAGLIGPWSAGLFFDWSGGYRLAMLTASVMGLVSALAIAVLFRDLRKAQAR
ncbi:MAG: hypothetical protein HKN18_15135 [Silicimonas sp.]|nr:hypothetical protein [Silicimonas sp.]